MELAFPNKEAAASLWRESASGKGAWEAAQSIPDVTKITQMSKLFGVTTDYLLFDSPDDEEVMPFAEPATTAAESTTDHIESSTAPAAPAPQGRSMSLDEANAYMDLVQRVAPKQALGVSLCIWAPATLILVNSLAALNGAPEDSFGGVGIGILLAFIAVAVFIFNTQGSQLSSYAFLETEPLNLEYGVEAVIRRRQEAHAPSQRLASGVGVALIIAGVIPLLVVSELTGSDAASSLCVSLLLALIGIAVNLFVRNGMVSDSYQRLLQEGEFSVDDKKVNKSLSWFPGVYWLTVTAIYLAWSFLTFTWPISWVIWPVAGVTYGVICIILRARAKRAIA